MDIWIIFIDQFYATSYLCVGVIIWYYFASFITGYNKQRKKISLNQNNPKGLKKPNKPQAYKCNSKG